MKSKKNIVIVIITLVSKLTSPFSPLKRKKIHYKSIGSNEHKSMQQKKKLSLVLTLTKKKFSIFASNHHNIFFY